MPLPLEYERWSLPRSRNVHDCLSPPILPSTLLVVHWPPGNSASSPSVPGSPSRHRCGSASIHLHHAVVRTAAAGVAAAGGAQGSFGPSLCFEQDSRMKMSTWMLTGPSQDQNDRGSRRSNLDGRSDMQQLAWHQIIPVVDAALRMALVPAWPGFSSAAIWRRDDPVSILAAKPSLVRIDHCGDPGPRSCREPSAGLVSPKQSLSVSLQTAVPNEYLNRWATNHRWDRTTNSLQTFL